MATSNAINANTAGIVGYNGTGTFTGTAAVNHALIVGGSTSGTLTNVGPSATAGQVLQSAGAAADPAFSTAAYPVSAGTSGNVITSDGTNFISSTVAASSKITPFLSDGTYTVDPRAKVVEFFVWAGGGGGGSGRCGATGSVSGGGGGGAGGTVYLKTFASLLTGGPYTVTIGTGGSGGASINAINTNGNPGNPGLVTSIGTIIYAKGGTGGTGGSGANALGGTSTNIRIFGVGSTGSVDTVNTGVASNNTSTPNSITTYNTLYTNATGGGAGSGYVSASPGLGGAAPSILDGNGGTLVAGGLAGSNSGGTGGDGNAPSGLAVMSVGATGGGGGGHNGTVTAGNGGNGAIPSGGGGGGAGNLSSNASGKGGDGAKGQVIIIEYF